jgi:hypothetical protein
LIIADEEVIFESPDASTIFCVAPGITRLTSGRLIVTTGLRGKGLASLPGNKGSSEGNLVQAVVLISDDQGKSWRQVAEFPFTQSRPFEAGDSVYVIGQSGPVMISRSRDQGLTWDGPYPLTAEGTWHQAPSNVWFANECVYLVMEKICYPDVQGWPVSTLAPVLMRGRLDLDLTRAEHWTLASELAFRDAVPSHDLNMLGVPFYNTTDQSQVYVAPGRKCAPIGWLETNVLQFQDPNHYWFDPAGRTFHLWMRAHTGGTGFAAIAKVIEQPDGRMITMLEKVPSGKSIVYVPCPGGHMKFHIIYDHVTGLFWLLSTQATDSMTRAELLPGDRYNLPNNERQRLQLHFSKNGVDWCFAGLVAKGASAKHARHYASMVIDGDDLLVASRSGNEQAVNAHDGNIITFHVVRQFRDLVY